MNKDKYSNELSDCSAMTVRRTESIFLFCHGKKKQRIQRVTLKIVSYMFVKNENKINIHVT